MKKSFLKSVIAITCVSTMLLSQGCASQGSTTQSTAPADSEAAEAQTATDTPEAEAAPEATALAETTAPAGATAAAATEAATQAEGLTSKKYTVYISEPEVVMNDAYPLYFLDGVEDLPYVDLNEWADLYVETHKIAPKGVGVEDDGYNLTVTAEGEKVTYERENGYSLVFDMDEDTLTFDDYDAFLMALPHTSIVESVDSEGTGENGEINLIQRLPEESFERNGDEIVIDLSSYDIDMVHKDGHYLVPLQTLNDLLVSPLMENSYLFNGQAIFYTSAAYMNTYKDMPDSVYSKFYSAPKGLKSQALADYNYNELCLAMDCLYGLKESHDIESFDALFDQIGFEERLRSTDPNVSDKALQEFIEYYLDDLHSVWGLPSYMGEALDNITPGRANISHNMAVYTCMVARMTAYPEGCPAYEEVGNTAYITFDNFTQNYKNSEWYSVENLEDYTSDTIGLILYAHRQITREGSPIENVVIDLSNNYGGQLDAGIVVASWLIGRVPISMRNTFTGASATAVYQADISLDHTIDENDVLTGKNIYCLISHESFSMGNALPSILKNSHKATILGKTSAGGTCVVTPLSTASGATFNISNMYQITELRNGSMTDIDHGVEPDFYIDRLENFYDREKLTEWINGLF